MPNDAPVRTQPLIGYLMTGFVIWWMIAAARAFFQSEAVLFRSLAAFWFVAGAVLLWLRWWPRGSGAEPPELSTGTDAGRLSR